jgi:hypothetical protein
MAKTSKKSATKKANGKPRKERKTNPLHAKLIALMSRPNGADRADIAKTGWKYPSMTALKIAERRGYKTSVVKKAGELSRYIAKRA